MAKSEAEKAMHNIAYEHTERMKTYNNDMNPYGPICAKKARLSGYYTKVFNRVYHMCQLFASLYYVIYGEKEYKKADLFCA